jgi:hypothetical protein
LLTYDYDSPYTEREKLYRIILNSYDSSLIFPYDYYISSDASKNFNLSSPNIPSLIQSGFQYLPPLSFSLLAKLLALASANLTPLVDSPKSVVPPEILHSSLPVLSLFSSRHIIDIVSRYLGIFPSIQYISLWKTDSTSSLRTPEMYWHVDHHGHKFIKAFYYLTDVLLGFGHHEFICETHHQPSFDSFLQSNQPNFISHIHRKRRERGKYRLPDDLLLPFLPKTLRLDGQAGSGFMEDTRGLHRGTAIISNVPRIIIQALYVPFNSMKDPIDTGCLDSNSRNQIRSENSYTDLELNKLFHLIH